jgi:hypothetical protein
MVLDIAVFLLCVGSLYSTMMIRELYARVARLEKERAGPSKDSSNTSRMSQQFDPAVVP